MKPLPELVWSAHAEVPFDYRWSKNRIWRRGQGRTYLAPWARARRDELAFLLRARIAPACRRIAHNRLWMGIEVYKADHRGDAINVLDLVADAVQLATDLDDKWYSVSRIDWDLDPQNPRLVVEVGQEDLQDALPCGRCGRLLAPDAFNRCRGGPLGRAGTCRTCLRRGRVQLKADRERLHLDDRPPEPVPRRGAKPPW